MTRIKHCYYVCCFVIFQILQFQRVIFELEYNHEDDDHERDPDVDGIQERDSQTEDQSRQKLLLRGQMKYIKEWEMIAFLCTPL